MTPQEIAVVQQMLEALHESTTYDDNGNPLYPQDEANDKALEAARALLSAPSLEEPEQPDAGSGHLGDGK